MSEPINTEATPAAASCLSCVGCKWLYQYGTGYSNFTWENDVVCCAKDRNPNLHAELFAPSDWTRESPEQDNWPMTNASRCKLYMPGPFVALDVDGENFPAEFTDDQEVIEGIAAHCGRKARPEA